MELSLQIDEGCAMIAEIGKHFKCDDVTIGQAMLIYHHYQNFRDQRGFRKGDTIFHLFATAAFDYSLQIAESDLNRDEVISFCESFTPRCKKQPGDMEIIKATLKKIQSEMLRVIFGNRYRSLYSRNRSKDLVLNCDTAHKFILKYMDQFRSRPELLMDFPALNKLCLKNINAFYKCAKCTAYSPLEITWAAIHLAFEELGIDIEQIPVLKKELSAAVQTDRHQIAKNDMWKFLSLGSYMFELTMAAQYD